MLQNRTATLQREGCLFLILVDSFLSFSWCGCHSLYWRSWQFPDIVDSLSFPDFGWHFFVFFVCPASLTRYPLPSAYPFQARWATSGSSFSSLCLRPAFALPSLWLHSRSGKTARTIGEHRLPPPRLSICRKRQIFLQDNADYEKYFVTLHPASGRLMASCWLPARRSAKTCCCSPTTESKRWIWTSTISRCN